MFSGFPCFSLVFLGFWEALDFLPPKKMHPRLSQSAFWPKLAFSPERCCKKKCCNKKNATPLRRECQFSPKQALARARMQIFGLSNTNKHDGKLALLPPKSGQEGIMRRSWGGQGEAKRGQGIFKEIHLVPRRGLGGPITGQREIWRAKKAYKNNCFF